jgi:hypothetical protein
MAKTRSDKYIGAANLRDRGTFGNITNRLVNEQGTGASISGSIGRGISESFKAKITGIKEAFDPLNLVRKLTGSRTLTALAGRGLGRSKEDMKYFTGNRDLKSGRKNSRQVAGGIDAKALYTKIGEGARPRLRTHDSVADVLAKLYNLILTTNLRQLKDKKIEKNFRKEQESEKERRNKELIKALTGLKTSSVTVVKGAEGPSFFDMIKMAIDGVKTWVDNFVNGLFGWLNPLKWLQKLGWLAAFESLEGLAGSILKIFMKGGALAAVFAAAVAGFMLGKEFVAPLIDKIIQFHTGEKDATFGTWLESKYGPSKEIDEKMKSDNMELVVKSLEKKGSVDEDELTQMKHDMEIGPDGIGKYKDMSKEQFQRVNRLVHISPASAELKAATLLPDKENRMYGKRANGKFGKMSTASPAAPSEIPTPAQTTAAPVSPEPSSAGARVQSAINQNEDLKLSENTTPQIIKMDDSKNTTTQGSNPPMVDSSVTVRTDDVSLQRITKQNLRPV